MVGMVPMMLPGEENEMTRACRAEPSHEQDGYTYRREAVDAVRSRITLLEGRDRLIMKMYYENGVSATQIAALMGVSTSTVSRRIKTLSRRLVGDKYQNCTRNSHRLSSEELEIARDHFIRGLSLRSIAAEQGCSFYRIREIVRKIKLLGEIGGTRAPTANPTSKPTVEIAEGFG